MAGTVEFAATGTRKLYPCFLPHPWFGPPVVSSLVIQPVSRQAALEAHLAAAYPQYRRHFSNMAELEYFANVCECGANFGDYFLVDADGPFFPSDEDAASQVAILRLSFDGKMDFQASFSQGAGDLIWRCGKRA